MKILITGASGFVGSAIVSELEDFGHELIVTTRKKKIGDQISKKTVTYRLDLTVSKEFSEIEKLNNLDVIIHSAGLAHQFGEASAEDFYKANVLSTENLLNLAKKLSVRHFILISSVAVYGPTTGKSGAGAVENTVCQPAGHYATSKFKAEQIAQRFSAENDLPLTILRPVTVIGEGDRGNLRRLIKVIDEKKFIWLGRGENFKSLIYKKDLARACRFVLEKKGKETEIFNVAGEFLKMKKIVETIAVELDIKIWRIYIPNRFLEKSLKLSLKFAEIKKIRQILETIEKWTDEDVYSAKKIAGAFGFEPETGISEAISKEVNFYLANK